MPAVAQRSRRGAGGCAYRSSTCNLLHPDPPPRSAFALWASPLGLPAAAGRVRIAGLPDPGVPLQPVHASGAGQQRGGENLPALEALQVHSTSTGVPACLLLLLLRYRVLVHTCGECTAVPFTGAGVGSGPAGAAACLWQGGCTMCSRGAWQSGCAACRAASSFPHTPNVAAVGSSWKK